MHIYLMWWKWKSCDETNFGLSFFVFLSPSIHFDVWLQCTTKRVYIASDFPKKRQRTKNCFMNRKTFSFFARLLLVSFYFFLLHYCWWSLATIATLNEFQFVSSYQVPWSSVSWKFYYTPMKINGSFNQFFPQNIQLWVEMRFITTHSPQRILNECVSMIKQEN